ncbi:hypothetical protein ACF06X_26540 [Streptomyces sp. NPDC015346]|uniref:hypothetical protein n=1 Tax=Streptomyces sp. NPDC015346 TaxID=3364954 RepID=UPI0037005CAB
MCQQWYLPRHGITVATEKVAVYSHNGRASYEYTDLHGGKHRLSGKDRTGTTYAAYHPSDPDKEVLCYSLLKVALHMVASLVLLLLGLGVVALVISVTGGVLLDG